MAHPITMGVIFSLGFMSTLRMINADECVLRVIEYQYYTNCKLPNNMLL